MCGIVGVVGFPKETVDEVLQNLSLRGRDGIGYYTQKGKGNYRAFKSLVNPKDLNSSHYKDGFRSMLVGNARAVPTTEFQSGAGLSTENQQPFSNKRYVVVHNGLLANDKELIKQFDLKTSSPVDTAILPELFSKLGVEEGLRNLEGSFSIVVYDREENALYAGKNFTPMVYVKNADGILITSIKEMLPEELQDQAKELPPYSIMRYSLLDRTFTIDEGALYPKVEKKKKVLVICSSGIDSVVTAWVYRYLGYEVHLIHFLYGQAAQEAEYHCVQKLARELGTELVVYDAKAVFGGFAGVSELLKNKEAPKDSQMLDAESTFSYVPNRNAIFAMIAAGVAEMIGCDTVAFGGQQMDSVYPDNNNTFVEAVDGLLKYSLNWNTDIKFAAPLINLIKHEVVEVGIKVGVPFEYVCSCYYPEVKNDKAYHCGQCGCCQFRYNAFKMLGYEDNVEFKYKAPSGEPIGDRIDDIDYFIETYVRRFA